MAKNEKNKKGAGGEAAGKLPIEEWAKKSKTPDWQIAGAMRHNRWGAGRMVTKSEFKKAVDDFAGAPIDRPRAKRK